MDKPQEQPKKCFCARCFLPIEGDDKVDIEGQNFHKQCCMCCICRCVPTSLKMFYGHVFCNECFKNQVLNKFKGDAPRMHSNSWWMQWAPGMKPGASEEENKQNAEPKAEQKLSEEPIKKCICARCLQAVDDGNKIDIGGQSFHTQCARCYFCHCVPKDNVKIYYGQVFCEDCFHRHVMNRTKDNPSEFFKNCFEQWQNNTQFSEQMREFMASGKDNAPFIFMMQGAQPPFCRCGNAPQAQTQEWFQANEPRKSATTATTATVSNGEDSIGTWDLSFENRTETSEVQESCNESANLEIQVAAAEKIEKLTKYLHDDSSEKIPKKWQKFSEMTKDVDPLATSWVDFQDPKMLKSDLVCPKCLWQCGPIIVNSEFMPKVCCGDGSSFE